MLPLLQQWSGIGDWHSFLVWSPSWLINESPLLQTNKQECEDNSLGISHLFYFKTKMYQIWQNIYETCDLSRASKWNLNLNESIIPKWIPKATSWSASVVFSPISWTFYPRNSLQGQKISIPYRHQWLNGQLQRPPDRLQWLLCRHLV